MTLNAEPHFSELEAVAHGKAIGIDWGTSAVSTKEFQRAMCMEFQRAIEAGQSPIPTPGQTASIAAKNLFAFPGCYRREDILEAAYDEYWSERSDE